MSGDGAMGVSFDHRPPSDIDRRLTASGAVKLLLPARKYNTLRGTETTSVFDALPGSKAGVGAVELTTTSSAGGKPRQLPKALLPKDARRPSAAAAQPIKPGLVSVATVEPRRNSLADGRVDGSSRLTSRLSGTSLSSADDIAEDHVTLDQSEALVGGSTSTTCRRYENEIIVKPRQRSVVYEPNPGLLMLRQLKADKGDEFTNRSTNIIGDRSSVKENEAAKTSNFLASGNSSSNRRTSFADTLSYFSSPLTSGSGKQHDAKPSSRPSYVPKKSLKYHRFNTLDDVPNDDVTADDVGFVEPTSRVDRLEAKLETTVSHSVGGNQRASEAIKRCRDRDLAESRKTTIPCEADNVRNTDSNHVKETTSPEARVLRISPAASSRLTSTSIGVADEVADPSRSDAVSRDMVARSASLDPVSITFENSADYRVLRHTKTKTPAVRSPSATPPSSPESSDAIPPLPTSQPPTRPFHGSVNPSPVLSVDDNLHIRSAADSGAWNDDGGTLASGLMGWYLNSTPSGVGGGGGLVVYSHRPTDSNATVDSGHGSTTSGLMSDSHDDNGLWSGDENDVATDSQVLHQSSVTRLSDDLSPLHGSLGKLDVAFSEISNSSSSNGDVDSVVSDAFASDNTRGLLDHLLADNGTTLADLRDEMLSCVTSIDDGEEVRVVDVVDLSDNLVDIGDEESHQHGSPFDDGHEQLNDDELKTIDIAIVKGALGLGFCIEGGQGSAAGDRPLRIKRLFRNVNKSDSGSAALKAGDEITAVNGLDFTNLSHYEAWNRLKALPDGTFVLTIRR